jgi:hypothetical protein
MHFGLLKAGIMPPLVSSLNYLNDVVLDDDDKEVSAFRVDNGLGVEIGGIGCAGGGCESPLQEIGLRDEHRQLAEESNNSQESEKPRPPIGIKFFVGVTLFLLSYVCGFLGRQRLHDQRKLIGASLVGRSFLVLGLSLFLRAFGGRFL